MELYMELYIVRIYLKEIIEPLNLPNLPVFMDFEAAKNHAIQLSKSNQLKNKDNIDSHIFTNENRYYLVEDFISDKFLWIERHIL
jgi:hypothetical protein